MPQSMATYKLFDLPSLRVSVWSEVVATAMFDYIFPVVCDPLDLHNFYYNAFIGFDVLACPGEI